MKHIRALNKQYQKVQCITLVISLLSIYYIVDNNNILSNLLKLSVICFSLSIISSLKFLYVSASRIVETYSVPINRIFWFKIKGENTIQILLYLFYNITGACFYIGIILFLVHKFNQI
jgi:hypothetical protein